MSDLPASPRRPGGQMSSRPLHFYWITDSSGSMRVDGKIQALNNAIREAIPHMQTVALENPHASVLVRAMTFSDHARWLDDHSVPVADFQWRDLEASGTSSLGEALSHMAQALDSADLSERALPPVIALVTDGLPTDNFQAGLDHLMSKPRGRQALRIVIAIGEDAASHDAQNIFRAFGANDALRPFQANNPEALAEHIRWVATAVLKSVSSPSSKLNRSPVGWNASTLGASPADVW